jgi:hypothetical protein
MLGTLANATDAIAEEPMKLRLTIDIFSGRPNPVVELSGQEADEVIARLAPARKTRATTGRELPNPESTLGYRGIIVEQSGSRRLPSMFRVADGVLSGPKFTGVASDPYVDDFVCGSTGPIRLLGLGPEFSRRCLTEIERFRELRRYFPKRPPRWPPRTTCECAPLYEPAWWNDGGQKQFNNNCYNYGTNCRTDTFAQPGLAAGAMYTALTCAAVRPAAVLDALIAAPTANNRCPREGHLVALVIAPGWDFHWYRKGRNGFWTHKPGGTPVTNVDNSGVLIPDPRTADRGPYTNFCTFMIVMHGHTKIR